MMIKKLSEQELRVMDKIWENSEGVESSVIYNCFKDEYAVSTIGTILGRLLQKGCTIRKRKGIHHIFIPVIAKDEYYQMIEERELEKISGKIEGLLASFYGGKKLSARQTEKLKNMLKELKND